MTIRQAVGVAEKVYISGAEPSKQAAPKLVYVPYHRSCTAIKKRFGELDKLWKHTEVVK